MNKYDLLRLVVSNPQGIQNPWRESYLMNAGIQPREGESHIPCTFLPAGVLVHGVRDIFVPFGTISWMELRAKE